ncbi:MAG: type VII secretion protein EccCa [Ornithinimicrobium sp.]
MSAEVVQRSARSTPGSPQADEVPVERPPALPEGESGMGGLLMLVPMLGAGASMTVMMLFRGSSLAAVGALMMILTLVASVVMVFSQRGKGARKRRQQRTAYLAYLERTRAELQDRETSLAEAARLADPHPRALLGLAQTRRRLWERRRGDVDFLRVRLGTGEAAAHDFVRQGEDNALQLADTFMDSELELLEERFDTASDLPMCLDLDGAGNVSVVGDRAFGMQVARLMTAQAATLASPEDLQLALTSPPERITEWEWLRWLPHLADQRQSTPVGPQRRVAPSTAELMQVLREDLRRRMSTAAEGRRNLQRGAALHPFATMMVFIDEEPSAQHGVPIGDREISPADLGVSVIHLLDSQDREPDDVTIRISQRAPGSSDAVVERYERRDAAPRRFVLRLDDWTASECEALTRYLSGLRLSPDSHEHDASQQAADITRLMDVPDLTAIDLDRVWATRPKPSFLRVPLGTDERGDPVMLDLKESAQFGMGPHGLCVGATGSGKSELLRTLVLALLASHSPDDITMVLVDYKGGATFAPFAQAPHVSGVITNLSDDATLVERVYASLEGEVRRRQQVLKDAGDLADVTAYRKHRKERARQGESIPPLPHLLVIIDEFGELLTARPDFIELFLSIGRIGRSIGVHLLLSSQRIEGGKLRGLDTYLSYRIGLRTLSEAESRTVLETPDAFSLPALPGYGYLKVDTTIYTQFRSGYVSGPLPDDEEQEEVVPQVHTLPRYAVLEEAQEDSAEPEEGAEMLDDEEPSGPTVLSTMVEQFAARPRVGTPVWLPPLPDQLSLDQIESGVASTTRGPRIRHTRSMRVPMGLVDDPGKQWQGPWELDLHRSGGNVLLIGGPRTGRTTFLRTLAASLAITHGVDEAVVYGVDLLGSNLQALDDLPNVAGIGVRTDPEVVRRTVEEVYALLVERERVFQELRTDSLQAVRQATDPPEGVDPSTMMLAEVVLMVDGYGQVTEEFEELENLMQTLTRRGSGYGIHVVATVSRWNEVRLNQQTFFGTKIELRLGDPAESGVGRKLSETLTSAPPGRALLESKLFAQIALPRIDDVAERESAGEGLADLVAQASGASEDRAPRIRLLPATVTMTDLEEPTKPGQVALGLDESDLGTVMLDVNTTDRNLVVIGDSGTGKTALLRHLIAGLTEQYTGDELVLAIIDPRRGLHGVVPDEYLGGYAGSSVMAERLIAAILPELKKRSPDDVQESSDEALPLPRVVVIVDDYDVLTAGGTSPLQPLVPYIAMSAEINLDVVITRKAAGAARGVFESTFAAIRDSGATGLMFSGDRSEGQLLGTVRPQKLPTGRALIVRAGQSVRTVQVALRSTDHEDELGGRGFGSE